VIAVFAFARSKGLGGSADHVRSLGCSAKEYSEVKLRAKRIAQISDLPAVLERMRDTVGIEHPRTFNLARAHALAFLRVKFKRTHPLWAAVAAVELRTVPKSTRRRPLTVEQMRNFFPKPDTDPVDGMAWTMTTTWMHQKE
jgi:hypothetical protein